MRRVLRISDVAVPARSDLPHGRHGFSLPKSLTNPTRSDNRPAWTRWLFTEKPGSGSSKPISDLYAQFADKWVYAEARAKEELTEKARGLRDELLRNVEDESLFEKVLEVEGWDLFKIHSDGAALLELLQLLEPYPHLAIKVFNWRRRREDPTWPMVPEEYSKGIKLAGRTKNLDLAVEIFAEAASRRSRNASTYNALMAAYMWNGLGDKCQSVFSELKHDAGCGPTLVTYNILISLFGRTVLIDRMEAARAEMEALGIAPNLTTYNNLIAGYVTAWMWDRMEDTFRAMETEPGPVRPDLDTRLLMLRGYAHAGRLEEMEAAYDAVGPHVEHRRGPLLRAMICAYCKSPPRADRVERIEGLLSRIPAHEYRPWLNVLLIKVYAQAGLVDRMDRSIDEAFDRCTAVHTVRIMRCIVTAYFRTDAVDRLARFVRRAEGSGWRICRTLYHALLCMYASHRRIQDMEHVLSEMERFNYGCTKRTLIILYKAYSEQHEQYADKVHRLLGLMCKYGYGIPSS